MNTWTIPAGYDETEITEQYPYLTAPERDMFRQWDILEAAKQCAKQHRRTETVAGLTDLQDTMSTDFRALLETAKTRQYVALTDADMDAIKTGLLEYDSGKNSSCWAVCGFGWKDADIEPHGCTGISSIAKSPGGVIHVEFGGHKTIAPPEDEEGNRFNPDIEPSFEDLAGSGDMVEWSGDGWDMSFSDSLDIPAIPNSHNTLDVAATVEAIATQVQASIAPHSNGWALTEASIYGDESISQSVKESKTSNP